MVFDAKIRQVSKMHVLGTFPGTNGFSGLGYFASQTLLVVHKGKLPFNGSKSHGELDISSESPFDVNEFGPGPADEFATIHQHEEEISDKMVKFLHSGNHSPESAQDFFMNAFKDIREYVGVLAHSPQAQGVRASLALESSKMVSSNPDVLPLCSE